MSDFKKEFFYEKLKEMLDSDERVSCVIFDNDWNYYEEVLSMFPSYEVVNLEDIEDVKKLDNDLILKVISIDHFDERCDIADLCYSYPHKVVIFVNDYIDQVLPLDIANQIENVLIVDKYLEKEEEKPRMVNKLRDCIYHMNDISSMVRVVRCHLDDIIDKIEEDDISKEELVSSIQEVMDSLEEMNSII